MLALVLLAASALLAGCQQDSRPTLIQGVVVDMQAASFVRVGSFTLRTNDGQLIEMAAEGDIGMTAGHLREHMTLAEPVAVTVRYDGDRVIATYVDDATTPTPASAPAKP